MPAGSGPIDPNDILKLVNAAQSGVPYDKRPGAASIDEYTYNALARAKEVRGTQVILGGEPHVFVADANGQLRLAIGEPPLAPAPPLGAA